METREIFDAAPLAVGQFLSETGQGLYIPPYQRAYSWEQSKVRRLIADVIHGLAQITDLSDSICFLGSVIALRDLHYTTVEPIHRHMVPPKVMTIIDGQQRLTTLLLLTTILHEEIYVRANKLPKSGGPARDWCYNQAIDITSRLTDTFEEDMRYGEGNFRYYPRMIRSYHDVWSRNKSEAKYDSPIGYFLHEYGKYARGVDSTKDYKHNSFVEGEATDANSESHKHLESTRAFIRRTLRGIVSTKPQGIEEEAELLSGRAIAECEGLQVALFNSPFPVDAIEAIKNDDRISALARLIVLANYLLSRVTVAVVTAKREDYAFDMFEALNTTGQPLTAIETFKPKAIQNETLAQWSGSDSYGYFDTIEKYLDEQGASSADKRQSATNNVLIPFALMHDGTKLSKRLSEQRRYLRGTFEKEPDPASKRVYLHALAEVTRFISGPWVQPEQIPVCTDEDLRKQAVLCLQVLSEAKHDIVVAPLARYYAAHRLATDEIDDRAREMLMTLRACAAFFGLWRGAYGSTNGIDNVYRKLMNSSTGAGARFSRFGLELTEVPPAQEMLAFLRSQLHDAGLDDRERWIARASTIPVYRHSRQLTKFLLLAASNDSTPDLEHPGLITHGRPGLLSTMTLGRWSDDAFSTIEHIAPQNPSPDGWEKNLYDDPDMVHFIGNLTLLPPVENSSASDRSWPLKRLMFRALSSSTVEEAEEMLAQAGHEGVILGDGAESIIRRARYLPLVKALARREDNWSSDFVRQRSQRLCGLAWDSLAPGLGL